MAEDIYTPERLFAAVEQIERGAAVLIANEWGPDVEAQMRSEAPWTDRNLPSLNGLNARQNLNVQVEYLPGNEIRAVASSDRRSPTIWKRTGEPAIVAAFLELGTRFMAKRDVIWPTLVVRTPDLKARLDTMLAPSL